MGANTDIIRTVIVDDQPACIKVLRDDLESFPGIEVAGTYTSARQAEKEIIRLQPSLLFLDIVMPSGSGLDLLPCLDGKVDSLRVVFYTVFDRYMIDAIRSAAFDYLLKPYTREELALIIQRAREKCCRQGTDETEALRKFLTDQRKFALQTVTGLLLLQRKEIVYFEHDTKIRCWRVILTNGETHNLRPTTSSKDILLLGGSLSRLNHHYIVNSDYIAAIEHASRRCILCPPFNNIELSVSRRHYNCLREKLEII